MWLIFALIFALCSSLSTVIAKDVMRRMDEYSFLAISGIVTIPFLLFIIIAFYRFPKVDLTFWVSILVSVGIGIFAAILAYKAIRESEISLVNPISAFNPIFTVIISYIILRETISPKEIFGILTIIVGAYTLQIAKAKEGFLKPFKTLIQHKGVRFSLIAYFLWAITPIFEKTAIGHTYPSVPPFASLVGLGISTFVFSFLVLMKPKTPKIFSKKNILLFLFLGLLGGVGQTAAFSAFSLARLGLVTSVFKTSMIFTVIFGWVIFKEKDFKERLLGSAIMLLGVILLV